MEARHEIHLVGSSRRNGIREDEREDKEGPTGGVDWALPSIGCEGEYVHASPVHPAETAAIVRVREGRPIVTDGPFIETREQMAGYFLIEAKDRDEAVAIAGRVPGARIGTVEVRQVREITGLP